MWRYDTIASQLRGLLGGTDLALDGNTDRLICRDCRFDLGRWRR